MTGIAFPGLAMVGVAQSGIARAGIGGSGLGFAGGRGGAVPLIPAGGKMAALGDSIVARNLDPQTAWSASSEQSNSAVGVITSARMLDKRFDFYGYFLNAANPNNVGGPNRGVSGDTSVQMLARITDVTTFTVAPTCFYLAGGTNDIRDAANLSAATIFANLVACITAVRAQWPGTPVIFNTIRATADVNLALTYGITAAQLTKMQAVNQLIRDYCAANSWCILCDIFNAYALPSGYADPTLLQDGLHPNTVGTSIEAVDYLLPAIRRVYGPGSTLETGTSLYPFDFSIPGGDTANGCTGVVPLGMRVFGVIASPVTSCVSSLVTEGGIAKVRLDFTPGGTLVDQFRLSTPNTFNTITVTNNAWLKFMVDVETSANFLHPGVLVEFYKDTTSGYRSIAAKYSPTVGFAPKAYTGRTFTITTEALQAAGTTFSALIRMVTAIDGNRAGAVWVKFSNPRLLVVPNPSTK